jgi:hypothetical protein
MHEAATSSPVTAWTFVSSHYEPTKLRQKCEDTAAPRMDPALPRRLLRGAPVATAGFGATSPAIL